MTAPFVVFGLPRSRTFWLSRFLSYAPWHCTHDHAVYLRSVDDLKSWLSIDWQGSCETAAAPWWRLARHYRPDMRILVVRRDRAEVIESLLRFDVFNRGKLNRILSRLDRALDSAAAAPGAQTVAYSDLMQEDGCKRVFEHCLQQPFDRYWWASLAEQNLQTNLRAQLRYVLANSRQITATAKACAQAQRYVCLPRQVQPEPDADGVVIQEESLSSWWQDGQALIGEHCLAIGKPRAAAQEMNLPLFDQVARAGAVQIITARINGRMVGYLTAMLVSSFEQRDTLLATQFSLFVSPDAKQLNLTRRLQRACIDRARQRGAQKMYMRAGVRGDGPRLAAVFRRMGARDYGQLYELDLV